MKSIFFVIATALLICSLGGNASAQISNSPFAFGSAGSGAAVGFGAWSAVGMSPAYRQMILQRKLLDPPTASGTFMRGPDGTLLNIDRNSSQAFPSALAAPFLTAAPGIGASGVSIGGDGSDIYVGYGISGASRTPVIMGAAPGSVPIDSWINQLNFIRDVTS